MQAKLGEVNPVLEECRKAIAVLRGITGDKPRLTGGLKDTNISGMPTPRTR